MRGQGKFSAKAIILAAVVAVFLLLNWKGYLEPVKNAASSLLTSGFSGTRNNAVEARGALGSLFSLAKIREENKQLRELEIELVKVSEEKRALESENEELRNQIDVLPRAKYALATAEIVASAIDDPEGFIVINRGERDGIKKGMPVVTLDKIFVGEIHEVAGERSKVLLSVNPDERNSFNVLMTKAQVVGVAKGRYNLEIIVDLIPGQAEITSDEVIVTSGKNQKYPEGLVVGRVVNISKSTDGLFKQAVVKPFYSVSELRFVSVITGSK